MFNVAVPVFDNVIVFAELVVPRVWLPKLRDFADTLAAAPLFPIPTKKMTCCGSLYALSVRAMVPPRDQVVVGVKVTVIVQDEFTATIPVVQLSVSEKSPVESMSLIVKPAVPVLLTVTVCVALLFPTNTPLKLRLAGVSVTTGATPVPLKDTLCGLPEALSAMLTVDVPLPVLVGVKTTLIAQLALTPRDDPQLLVCEKSV
jgi:hypothetical protein